MGPSQPESTKNSLQSTLRAQPTTGVKKKKTIMRKVVKKRMVSTLVNHAFQSQPQVKSLVSTPDSRHDRNLMAQTATNLLMSQQSSEGRSPKLMRRNFSSHMGLSTKMNRAQNSSMSSLHSGMMTQDLGGSLTRSFQTVKSTPNLMRKIPAKQVSKKRLATPIKVKGGRYNSQTIIDDDEDDDLIKSLTKEIEELRAKRLSHDLYKKATVEDTDEEDFETAIFAETLLGELGSSSGSHKDAFEVDNHDVLDGDSGASDRGSTTRQQMQPAIQIATSDTAQESQNQQESGASPNELTENNSHASIDPQVATNGLPLVDIPAGQTSSETVQMRSQLESKLISQLETEISGLLGSIKVQASSIKETLKKQKSIMTEGSDLASNDDQKPAISLDDVKIDVTEDLTDLNQDNKLDQSINSVIKNEDDASSALDTSIISVIQVKDSDAAEKDKSELGQSLVGDQVEEVENEIPAAKVENENLTLSMTQFELLLSDLKTKHLAEKRMLQCDLTLCKKVIKLMASCMKTQSKDKQRNEIRMLQIKKLQEVNKFLKNDNTKLTHQNKTLTDQCSKLKTLMVSYEQEALYQRLESDYIYEQLAKENDSLKRLLLINHDFTSSIEERIKEVEREEQQKQLQKFRELNELREQAEEKLRASLAMTRKDQSADKKIDEELQIRENDIDDLDDFDKDGDDLEMPDEVKKIVQERMKETAQDKQQPFDSSDMYLDDFRKNFGAVESRNAANRSNKPISAALSRDNKITSGSIRVLNDDDFDDDSDDDDAILNRENDEDLRRSFGKKKPGMRNNSLAAMKANMSLQEELGAMKSDLQSFSAEQEQNETLKTSSVKDISNVEERDDADDLDDDSDEDNLDHQIMSKAIEPEQTNAEETTDQQSTEQASKEQEPKAKDDEPTQVEPSQESTKSSGSSSGDQKTSIDEIPVAESVAEPVSDQTAPATQTEQKPEETKKSE